MMMQRRAEAGVTWQVGGDLPGASAIRSPVHAEHNRGLCRRTGEGCGEYGSGRSGLETSRLSLPERQMATGEVALALARCDHLVAGSAKITRQRRVRPAMHAKISGQSSTLCFILLVFYDTEAWMASVGPLCHSNQKSHGQAAKSAMGQLQTKCGAEKSRVIRSPHRQSRVTRRVPSTESNPRFSI
jgi:hypothetical protein